MGRGAVGSCKRRGTEGTWKRSFERHGGLSARLRPAPVDETARHRRRRRWWVSGHWQCLPCRASLSADHPVPTFSTANCRGVQPGESVHEKIAHRFFTWHKARNPAVLGWDTARQLQAHRRADAAIGGPVYTVRYTRPRTGTSPRLPRRAGWRAGRPQESGSHRLATASSRPPSLRSLAEPVGQWPLPICWFRRRVCGEQARQGR